jgi:aryl-alcohol dehydrogenase-like predicted oxidoreductase
LAGARNKEQAEQNAKAAQASLSAGEVTAITEELSKLKLVK